MKNNMICRIAFVLAAFFAFSLAASAQITVPSTFKHITIDGSFDDWAGVPLAYTATEGPSSAIQYENIYIANDQTNLYLEVSLYSPWPAFQDSLDNIFIDTDHNPATGFGVGGIGSELLIQWGSGYDERNGGFNSGGVNNLGWNIAGDAGETNFELSISLGATYAVDGAPVFPSNTIALLLEGDNTNYVNEEFAPPSGGLVYTFTSIPATIITQPSNQFAVEGKPASFSVGTAGTAPVQYQWYFGDSAISGATNAIYTIAACASSNAGSYHVAVSNPVAPAPINSSPASLTILPDTLPPNVINIGPSASYVVVSFSEAVDPVTGGNAANYSISGLGVTSAAVNTNNSSQVILTTGSTVNFGVLYTLTVNGVKDLFGNVAHVTGQFTRDITIDGSFGDWTGLSPVYTTAAPSGNTDVADFKAIYVYNDANYFYFRVTLWTDIDPSYGQFPYYVNMFFDTDDDPDTGFSALGFDMLVQSGYSYQEKDGNFNDGFGINGLNWLCLPAEPGTNFEFKMSRSATFGEDGTPVFTADSFNFLFQGMTPAFAVENTAPASGGTLSYTVVTPVTVPPLPLGKMAVFPVAGGNVAVVWDQPGTLQSSTNLATNMWTTLSPAASPYIVPAAGTAQFYRLAY